MHDRLRRFAERRGAAQRMVRPSAAFREDTHRQTGLLPAWQHEVYPNVLRSPFPRRGLDQSDQSGLRRRVGSLPEAP